MTPADFTNWLAEMRAAGRIRSDADAGRLLEVNKNTLTNLKARGGDRRTALACRALIEGLVPWGDGHAAPSTETQGAASSNLPVST